MKKFLALVVVASVAVCAFAQNPVGTWKGKIQMDASKLPKAKDATQQKQLDAAMAQVRAITITLSLNANKTYKISVPPMGGQPGHTGEGTWVQKGKTLTLSAIKEDGKAPKDKRPQTVTMDSARKMTMVPPTGGPMGIKIVFAK
jgi:hypothetical protein